MKKHTTKYLYYITHIENVQSILDKGILSHDIIEKEKIKFTPIYDQDIVNKRKSIKTPDGKSLWEFANLYFQPRNPMLYRVVSEKLANNIVIKWKLFVQNAGEHYSAPMASGQPARLRGAALKSCF